MGNPRVFELIPVERKGMGVSWIIVGDVFENAAIQFESRLRAADEYTAVQIPVRMALLGPLPISGMHW